MFCKFCGNQLPDEAKFCNRCGKSLQEVEQPVAQEPAVAQTVVPPQPVAMQDQAGLENGAGQPKNKKWIKWVAIGVAVVVALGALWLLIGDSIVNACKLTVMKPEKYYGSIEYKALDKAMNKAEGSSDFNMNDFHVDSDVSLQISDQGKQALSDWGVDADSLFSGNEVSATIDANGQDGNYSGNVTFSVEGTEILTAIGAISSEDQEVYAQIPALDEQWLFAQLPDEFSSQLPEGMEELITDENKELVASIVRDSLKVASKNLPEMERSKDTLEVNGLSKKYNTFTMEITEENMAPVLIAVLEALEDNKDLVRFVQNNEDALAQLTGMDEDALLDSMYDAIDEAIDWLEQCEDDSVLAQYTVWIDGKGNIMGREVCDATGKQVWFGFYNVVKGTKVATSVVVADGMVELSGQASVGVTKVLKNGEYTLSTKGLTNSSCDVATIYVNKLNTNNGDMDISLQVADQMGDLLVAELAGEQQSIVQDMIENYALRLVINTSKNKGEYTLSIEDDGDALLTLSLTTALDRCQSLDWPNKVTEAETYMNNVDGEEFAQDIMDKLEDAGVHMDALTQGDFYSKQQADARDNQLQSEMMLMQ